MPCSIPKGCRGAAPTFRHRLGLDVQKQRVRGCRPCQGLLSVPAAGPWGCPEVLARAAGGSKEPDVTASGARAVSPARAYF